MEYEIVPNRKSPSYEARRQALDQLRAIGRELRIARITSGKRQLDIARAIGVSTAHVSRIERGLVEGVTMGVLARFATAVGLRIWLRAFPAGRRLLDAPQLALWAEFKPHFDRVWQLRTEVPIPIPGDLRAADAVANNGSCTVEVELITRLADFQAQSRSALLKKRDLRANRLILVVNGSRANREALKEARDLMRDTFPLDTRAIKRALRLGEDPGADGIVIM